MWCLRAFISVFFSFFPPTMEVLFLFYRCWVKSHAVGIIEIDANFQGGTYKFPTSAWSKELHFRKSVRENKRKEKKPYDETGWCRQGKELKGKEKKGVTFRYAGSAVVSSKRILHTMHHGIFVHYTLFYKRTCCQIVGRGCNSVFREPAPIWQRDWKPVFGPIRSAQESFTGRLLFFCAVQVNGFGKEPGGGQQSGVCFVSFFKVWFFGGLDLFWLFFFEGSMMTRVSSFFIFVVWNRESSCESQII